MSYEDTGQFAAVVGQLNDPLNDPLPGHPPAAPDYPAYAEAAGTATAPEAAVPEALAPEAPASPWFRAQQAPPEPAPPPAPVRSEPVSPPPVSPALVRRPSHRRPEPPHPEVTHPDPPQGPQAPHPEAVRPEAVRPELLRQAEPVRPEPPRQAGPMRPEPPRRAGVEETARLPVISEVMDPPADPEAPEDPGAAPLLAPPPSDGGRAARRKAAQKGGGGHRARNRTPAAPGRAGAEPAGPLSRVEARRAAKAAKESPAVIASRIVGELFITTGVLMLLFVTYQLWWTNVRAHQQANSASNHLEHQWDTEQGDPERAAGAFSPGQGFAIMYIPKLDVKAPIAQGVSKHKVLDKGMIGHYDGALNTAMPWDKTGNFAVAAHRNTHGEPFRYINHLVPGDKVVVETGSTYYTYRITSSLPSTPPSNVSVLRPVPVGSGYTGPGRYLTLTTCTPEFTSTNRLIVWGKLIEERPRSKGKPDALVE
ncbi:class E sortase [Streptomyces sp. NBC_00138]|uniref:class E sortase n=1 Tax=Streptomyces sp. NBC_00138 TaxID=2903625 RepID=UPI002E2BF376|nr:class E sortase [Streptomyces sp. NBC_00223]